MLEQEDAVLPLCDDRVPHNALFMPSTWSARTKIKRICRAELPPGGMSANMLAVQLERFRTQAAIKAVPRKSLHPSTRDGLQFPNPEVEPHTSSAIWGKDWAPWRRLQERWPRYRGVVPKQMSFSNPSTQDHQA